MWLLMSPKRQKPIDLEEHMHETAIDTIADTLVLCLLYILL